MIVQLYHGFDPPNIFDDRGHEWWEIYLRRLMFQSACSEARDAVKPVWFRRFRRSGKRIIYPKMEGQVLNNPIANIIQYIFGYIVFGAIQDIFGYVWWWDPYVCCFQFISLDLYHHFYGQKLVHFGATLCHFAWCRKYQVVEDGTGLFYIPPFILNTSQRPCFSKGFIFRYLGNSYISENFRTLRWRYCFISGHVLWGYSPEL